MGQRCRTSPMTLWPRAFSEKGTILSSRTSFQRRRATFLDTCSRTICFSQSRLSCSASSTKMSSSWSGKRRSPNFQSKTRLMTLWLSKSATYLLWGCMEERRLMRRSQCVGQMWVNSRKTQCVLYWSLRVMIDDLLKSKDHTFGWSVLMVQKMR